MNDMNSVSGPRFYGKYRGTVVNNLDPEQRARLTCLVPDVLGLVPSSWAEACAPLAGPSGTGMGAYFVPPVGAKVWVEFEQGDPNYPVWTGCRFEQGEIPPLARAGVPAAPSIVLQTAGQNVLAISDAPGPAGGLMLKSATGVSLIVNDTGIYLQNGKGASINLVGPNVDVNNGALSVI
ncbi:phage baseplate assembly protein V [Massilia sp. W12]|uniref:phage baseplate assembly protein V n=1 Tax=Massilia sp. W12 TaxID=3126507 RepID=UPI0030CB9EA2